MLDDAIRQFQEPPRQPGAKVQALVPTTAAPAVAKLGDTSMPVNPRQRVEARLLTTSGPAHTETGNVWHGTPQLEMEIGEVNEQLYVHRGNGAMLIDPRIAPNWVVILSGTATLSFGPPAAIPHEQVDAGRDRNRASGVSLVVVRSGFKYAFRGVQVPSGTADRVHADANEDEWVAVWRGGPDLSSGWKLHLIASGFEAG